MKIRPLHDRLIVRRWDEANTSPGGIVIPDSATEKPAKGEVVSVGNGKILEKDGTPALIRRINKDKRAFLRRGFNKNASKKRLKGVKSNRIQDVK